jgi:hypothetical protein
MSRVTRTTAARHAVRGLALAGFATSFVAGANAGDLYPPGYGAYPLAAPAPVYERTFERERYFAAAPAFHGRVAVDNGPCRIVLKRKVDAWGRELVHRIRVCDEGPVYGAPNGPVVLPENGYGPPRYYEPSGYYGYPRPPVAVGVDYYN